MACPLDQDFFPENLKEIAPKFFGGLTIVNERNDIVQPHSTGQIERNYASENFQNLDFELNPTPQIESLFSLPHCFSSNMNQKTTIQKPLAYIETNILMEDEMDFNPVKELLQEPSPERLEVGEGEKNRKLASRQPVEKVHDFSMLVTSAYKSRNTNHNSKKKFTEIHATMKTVGNHLMDFASNDAYVQQPHQYQELTESHATVETVGNHLTDFAYAYVQPNQYQEKKLAETYATVETVGNSSMAFASNYAYVQQPSQYQEGFKEMEMMYSEDFPMHTSLGLSYYPKAMEEMYQIQSSLEYELEMMMHWNRENQMRVHNSSKIPKFSNDNEYYKLFELPSASIPNWRGMDVRGDMYFNFIPSSLLQLPSTSLWNNAANHFQVQEFQRTHVPLQPEGKGRDAYALKISSEESNNGYANGTKKNGKKKRKYVDIVDHGLPLGWRVLGKRRENGVFIGSVDKIYFPPGEKKMHYRSRSDAVQHIMKQKLKKAGAQ